MKTIHAIGLALLVTFGAGAQTNNYLEKKLVTNTAAGGGVHVDANLVNPWGLSRTGSSPWWVSDNGTGLSTLYKAAGTAQSLKVTIQSASGSGPGQPTGTVVFSNFAFCTGDGTIQTWIGPGSSGTNMNINNSAKGASYTGCTVGKVGSNTNLYVANAGGSGSIEAYTLTFTKAALTGNFTDPLLPAGYLPYGIQTIGTTIYVTYFSPTAPPTGNGWVSAYDTNGNFKLRLNPGTSNVMSNPWGIAKAPTKWGKFSSKLLVGMQGSGQIAAFNPTTGAFIDVVRDAAGNPFSEPGLWAIYFGGGTNVKNDGPKTTLFFASGGATYSTGLFGSLVFK